MLSVALALFGPGSFIEERVARPAIYINESLDYNAVADECTNLMPFTSLLPRFHHTDCFTQVFQSSFDLHWAIIDYIQLFADVNLSTDGPQHPWYDKSTIENAFNMAIFLANKLWLKSIAYNTSLRVRDDQGTTSRIPHISITGVSVLSTLLAIYLASLLSMAAYSIWEPHWSGRFDAFAMIRIGSAMTERVPLQAVGDVDKIALLDETPGWIGDGSCGEGELGHLALGAGTPLRARRRFACPKVDHQPEIVPLPPGPIVCRHVHPCRFAFICKMSTKTFA